MEGRREFYSFHRKRSPFLWEEGRLVPANGNGGQYLQGCNSNKIVLHCLQSLSLSLREIQLPLGKGAKGVGT